MSVKARNSLRSNVSSFGCMKRNRTIPPVGQRVSESLDRRAECLNVRPRASQSRPRAVPNDHPRRTARKISAGFARTARLAPARLTLARASRLQRRKAETKAEGEDPSGAGAKLVRELVADSPQSVFCSNDEANSKGPPPSNFLLLFFSQKFFSEKISLIRVGLLIRL